MKRVLFICLIFYCCQADNSSKITTRFQASIIHQAKDTYIQIKTNLPDNIKGKLYLQSFGYYSEYQVITKNGLIKAGAFRQNKEKIKVGFVEKLLRRSGGAHFGTRSSSFVNASKIRSSPRNC
jgi:hypothetical protein